jgi:heme/copper-type cytochrome/quinol oxidase subunit 2
MILFITSIIFFKESKLLSLLGILLSPVSTYFFYESWTKLNYVYLAGFLTIPVILLSIATVMKYYKRESRREIMSERHITAQPPETEISRLFG